MIRVPHVVAYPSVFILLYDQDGEGRVFKL